MSPPSYRCCSLLRREPFVSFGIHPPDCSTQCKRSRSELVPTANLWVMHFDCVPPTFFFTDSEERPFTNSPSLPFCGMSQQPGGLTRKPSSQSLSSTARTDATLPSSLTRTRSMSAVERKKQSAVDRRRRNFQTLGGRPAILTPADTVVDAAERVPSNEHLKFLSFVAAGAANPSATVSTRTAMAVSDRSVLLLNLPDGGAVSVVWQSAISDITFVADSSATATAIFIRTSQPRHLSQRDLENRLLFFPDSDTRELFLAHVFAPLDAAGHQDGVPPLFLEWMTVIRGVDDVRSHIGEEEKRLRQSAAIATAREHGCFIGPSETDFAQLASTKEVLADKLKEFGESRIAFSAEASVMTETSHDYVILCEHALYIAKQRGVCKIRHQLPFECIEGVVSDDGNHRIALVKLDFAKTNVRGDLVIRFHDQSGRTRDIFASVLASLFEEAVVDRLALTHENDVFWAKRSLIESQLIRMVSIVKENRFTKAVSSVGKNAEEEARQRIQPWETEVALEDARWTLTLISQFLASFVSTMANTALPIDDAAFLARSVTSLCDSSAALVATDGLDDGDAADASPTTAAAAGSRSIMPRDHKFRLLACCVDTEMEFCLKKSLGQLAQQVQNDNVRRLVPASSAVWSVAGRQNFAVRCVQHYIGHAAEAFVQFVLSQPFEELLESIGGMTDATHSGSGGEGHEPPPPDDSAPTTVGKDVVLSLSHITSTVDRIIHQMLLNKDAEALPREVKVIVALISVRAKHHHDAVMSGVTGGMPGQTGGGGSERSTIRWRIGGVPDDGGGGDTAAGKAASAASGEDDGPFSVAAPFIGALIVDALLTPAILQPHRRGLMPKQPVGRLADYLVVIASVLRATLGLCASVPGSRELTVTLLPGVSVSDRVFNESLNILAAQAEYRRLLRKTHSSVKEYVKNFIFLDLLPTPNRAGEIVAATRPASTMCADLDAMVSPSIATSVSTRNMPRAAGMVASLVVGSSTSGGDSTTVEATIFSSMLADRRISDDGSVAQATAIAAMASYASPDQALAAWMSSRLRDPRQYNLKLVAAIARIIAPHWHRLMCTAVAAGVAGERATTTSQLASASADKKGAARRVRFGSETPQESGGNNPTDGAKRSAGGEGQQDGGPRRKSPQPAPTSTLEATVSQLTAELLDLRERLAEERRVRTNAQLQAARLVEQLQAQKFQLDAALERESRLLRSAKMSHAMVAKASASRAPGSPPKRRKSHDESSDSASESSSTDSVASMASVGSAGSAASARRRLARAAGGNPLLAVTPSFAAPSRVGDEATAVRSVPFGCPMDTYFVPTRF